MSLHFKIVGLFVCVAILPLVIFAGVAREQSLRLADVVADAQLVSEASGAARTLEQEMAVARSTLAGLAVLWSGDESRDLLGPALASGMGPRPEGFQALEILTGDGSVIARSGDTADASRCRDDRYSSLARVSVPVSENGTILSGLYWVGQDPALYDNGSLWVYDDAGALVAAGECGSDPGLPPGTTPEGAAAGLVEGTNPQAATWQRGGAFARIEGGGWVAITAGASILRDPVARFFRDYWLFVLALALTTLLAFTVLLRQVTGSLKDLTRAVERVAGGDLNPWLPTPGGDEIGRLTLAFSEMTDRLRGMVAQVDRSSRLAVLGKLSAFLAHEIRNPLSTVKMNLQRLQRWQVAGQIPAQYGVAISTALTEVDRLSTAVSNILQLTPGKPRASETMAVHGLVAEAAQLLQADFKRRGVEFRCEFAAETDRVSGQPGQIKSAFINLMLNALEAQPQGGQVEVRSHIRPGPVIELRFKDQGPGVPAEVRDRIFDPFFTTKELGSGIGLAVASQSIRDHGGDIRLEDPHRLGEGAEFVVTLPLAPAVAEEAPGVLEPRVAPWMESEG